MIAWESPEANRLIASIQADNVPQEKSYQKVMRHAERNLESLETIQARLHKKDPAAIFPMNIPFEDGKLRVVFYASDNLEMHWTHKDGSSRSVSLNQKPFDRDWRQGMVALGTIPWDELARESLALFN
jgi:hypothetical protein